MTQYLEASSGNVTPEMIAVAQAEFLEPEFIRREIAEGRLVIPANKIHLQKKVTTHRHRHCPTHQNQCEPR